MTDTVATPPASPISPGTSLNALNGSSAKKFDGEGLPFKAKLIGMEDLLIDRDEKICLDSMFKLKAVVRARGEHKQRIQLNLTMSAVNIIDDTTKAQIATHEIERISFVVIDPRDTRAFGYIYNTSDDRHQFWAIKTERVAAATVLALKELFELAFEQFTNAEKTKGEDTKSPSTVAPPVLTVPTLEQPQVTPISSPPPTQPAPVPTPAPPSLFDDGIWGESTAAVITQKSAPVESLWDMNEPVVPVAQPPPRSVDPLEDLFGDLSLTAPATQPPASTSTTNSLLGAFSNPVPPPVPTNQYANFYAQPPPPQPNLFNPTSTLLQQQQQQQQRPSTPTTMLLLPQQPPQQNLLSPIALSPVAPPPVTSPFAGLDLLGGLSTTTTTKTTKDSFFPNTAPKTMQQLLLEKQP